MVEVLQKFKVSRDYTAKGKPLVKVLILDTEPIVPALGEIWLPDITATGLFVIHRSKYNFLSNNNFDFEAQDYPLGISIYCPTKVFISVNYLTETERKVLRDQYLHQVLAEINPRR